MSAISHVNMMRRRSWLAAASLIAASWLVLAVWSLSPYAEWLDHAEMQHIDAAPAIRQGVFILGWTLMITAMMLPGTLLLLTRCLNNEPWNTRHLLPLVVPYLVVWAAFGSFSYWGDAGLHEAVEHHSAVAGAIAPGVLLLAGIYQLTPMKRVCLAQCRLEGTAFAALTQPGRYNLWITGLRHGLYCLGSCWALMLLMFALGGVNLLWMLVLGVIMTVERLNQQGDTVTQGLGVVLVTVSVLWIIVG